MIVFEIIFEHSSKFPCFQKERNYHGCRFLLAVFEIYLKNYALHSEMIEIGCNKNT